MATLEQKKAEIALLEAEEAFRAKKAAGKVTTKDKKTLRAVRQDFRETHRTAKPGASPEPIASRATQKGTG